MHAISNLLLGLLVVCAPAFAQGGPPYYTNDPGTPGNLNWEINLGYMPFFYSDQSVSHIPDVDINFGISDRIQLTYENAWLRVPVRRGITPASESFLMPIEFSRKFGPVDVNYEAGYQFVHQGPDGWIMGLVVGHDFTHKLEGDVEFYNAGTFHPSENQPTIDVGARYKIHRPVILMFMAGRSLEPTRSNQPRFIGYFGLQFLFPPKSYKTD